MFVSRIGCFSSWKKFGFFGIELYGLVAFGKSVIDKMYHNGPPFCNAQLKGWPSARDTYRSIQNEFTYFSWVYGIVHNLYPALEGGNLKQAQVGFAHVIEVHRRIFPGEIFGSTNISIGYDFVIYRSSVCINTLKNWFIKLDMSERWIGLGDLLGIS